MRALLLLALLVGCGVTTDPNAPERAPADEPRPPGAIEILAPPRADGAIAIVLDFYGERTGVEPPSVTVHWTGELIRTASGDPLAGIAYSCENIWVYLPGLAAGLEVGASNTALAHELAHCVRSIAVGDADGAHIDNAWWSDGLVHDAELTLKAAGH